MQGNAKDGCVFFFSPLLSFLTLFSIHPLEIVLAWSTRTFFARVPFNLLTVCLPS